MASTQDLKRRVRSISNTRKLTRAMELVASARLRRAQMRIESMRPYADRMAELIAGTAKAAGAVNMPLLERRETVQTVGIVPVVRAHARGAGRGQGGAVLHRRQEGRVDDPLPPVPARAVVDRVQRPPDLR